MATDVSTPLPQMSLRENTILTVTLDDAAARVTRLVVHGWQTIDLPGSTNVAVSDAYLPGAA